MDLLKSLLARECAGLLLYSFHWLLKLSIVSLATKDFVLAALFALLGVSAGRWMDI